QRPLQSGGACHDSCRAQKGRSGRARQFAPADHQQCALVGRQQRQGHRHVARSDHGLRERGGLRRIPSLSPPLILVTPAVLLIGGLYVFALLRVLWLSVSEPSLGFDNYRLLLTSETIHRVAWTTGWICS